MILSTINFFSHVLDLRCTMNVILPQRSPGEKQDPPPSPYRVLYLLHGYSDDHTAWQRWTSIERYVEGLNLVVIMPAIQNSFYTDMANGGKYFTFLSEELPEIAHDLFALSEKREETFVAGLSMGGYGAFKLALTYPEKFGAAASLSGVVDIAEEGKDSDDPADKDWERTMTRIFGNRRKVAGSSNDLFALAEKVSIAKIKPRLYQYCGSQDFLYSDNLRFRDFIRPLGFDFIFHEDHGEHSWKYWDKEIQKVLKWIDK